MQIYGSKLRSRVGRGVLSENYNSINLAINLAIVNTQDFATSKIHKCTCISMCSLN